MRATGQTVIKAVAVSPNAGPSEVIARIYIIQLPPPVISPRRNDNMIEILPGNGDGTFTDRAAQPTGRGPLDFVIGDFNGDGIPDIVTADLDGQTMTVLLGKGDGTFLSHSRVSFRASLFRWRLAISMAMEHWIWHLPTTQTME